MLQRNRLTSGLPEVSDIYRSKKNITQTTLNRNNTATHSAHAAEWQWFETSRVRNLMCSALLPWESRYPAQPVLAWKLEGLIWAWRYKHLCSHISFNKKIYSVCLNNKCVSLDLISWKLNWQRVGKCKNTNIRDRCPSLSTFMPKFWELVLSRL